MVPPEPIAQTALASLRQTPLRLFIVPIDTHDQTMPFQYTTVPESPTAQTSLAPLPQTPARWFGVALAAIDQALPFQCTMVPKAGLVSIATVMLVLALVTVFPSASCTVTATAGLIAASAAAPVGCTVKANLVGGPMGLRCELRPPESQAQSSQRSWIAALLSFLDMGSPTVPPEETIG